MVFWTISGYEPSSLQMGGRVKLDFKDCPVRQDRERSLGTAWGGLLSRGAVCCVLSHLSSQTHSLLSFALGSGKGTSKMASLASMPFGFWLDSVNGWYQPEMGVAGGNMTGFSPSQETMAKFQGARLLWTPGHGTTPGQSPCARLTSLQRAPLFSPDLRPRWGLLPVSVGSSYNSLCD